jgi:DNA polymerase-3 subunit gamma/tau
MVLACGASEMLLLSVDDEQRGALQKQAATGGLQTILAAAQILAETKNRMKGAAFSRVLLELALVRIATLDQLDNLAELIGQLRPAKAVSGGPTAPSVARSTTTTAPAMARTSREAPATSTMPNEAPNQPHATIPVRVDAGRTENYGEPGTPVAQGGREEDLGVTNSGGDANPTHLAASELSQPIPFEAGREGEIWSQVTLLLTDMAKSNDKNVSRTAISGPNTLVLMFPRSYDLSRQYFERSSEQLGKIERALEQVVGRPIKISLAVDEAVTPLRSTKSPTTSNPEVSEPKPADGSRDPLVQRALSVFGATVVRVETGSPPAQ